MIWILQVLVSVIFFANKLLILAGKKTGWLVGVVAATLAVVYFFIIELYVYTGLEFGLIVLMSYGYLKRDGEGKPWVETSIRFVTVIIMIALAYFAFAGMMTVIELASSIGLLGGTYLLTHEKVAWGWALSILAHLLAAILGFDKEQSIFAVFQLASAVISLAGVAKECHDN